MKIIVIIYLVINSLMWSCTNPSKVHTGPPIKKNSISGNNSDDSLYSNSNNSQLATSYNDSLISTKRNIAKLDSVSKNIVLPFGSDLLISNILPPDWFHNDKESIYPNKIYGTIQRGYNFLNKSISKSNFLLTPVDSINSIPLNDHISEELNVELTRSFANITYQLPNFGPYKCFYTYNETTKVPKYYLDKNGNKHYYVFEQAPAYYTEAGNLIMYDSLKKVAQIINIFNLKINSFASTSRYFYIDKNQIIRLFEISQDEESTTFEEEYVITVTKEGEIKINKLNNK